MVLFFRERYYLFNALIGLIKTFYDEKIELKSKFMMPKIIDQQTNQLHRI